ncbi:MAG: APC family permease [Acidimicrobiales bacterium]
MLYGLGTAIGAGIYVLIGEASGRAGLFAPLSFILAGACLAPTAASYAELAGRLPVSAGASAYVRTGFNSKTMGQVAGWLVIFASTFAAAAVADGSVGYLREFVDLSPALLVILVVMTIGVIAAWGISESVAIAATLTIIEAAGLLAIVGFGLTGSDSVAGRVSELVPDTLDLDLWNGVFSASLLAVFAFIGFEDMANVAEETKNPPADPAEGDLHHTGGDDPVVRPRGVGRRAQRRSGGAGRRRGPPGAGLS